MTEGTANASPVKATDQRCAADEDDRRKRRFHEDAGGDDDRIYGFTMIGLETGEVVAMVQTAMLAGLPYTGLCDAILATPLRIKKVRSLVPGKVDIPTYWALCRQTIIVTIRREPCCEMLRLS